MSDKTIRCAHCGRKIKKRRHDQRFCPGGKCATAWHNHQKAEDVKWVRAHRDTVDSMKTGERRWY